VGQNPCNCDICHYFLNSERSAMMQGTLLLLSFLHPTLASDWAPLGGHGDCTGCGQPLQYKLTDPSVTASVCEDWIKQGCPETTSDPNSQQRCDPDKVNAFGFHSYIGGCRAWICSSTPGQNGDLHWGCYQKTGAMNTTIVGSVGAASHVDDLICGGSQMPQAPIVHDCNSDEHGDKHEICNNCGPCDKQWPYPCTSTAGNTGCTYEPNDKGNACAFDDYGKCCYVLPPPHAVMNMTIV